MHIYANSRMGEFYQCVSMILIMTMVIFQSGYLYALDYPRGDINGDGVINQDDVAPLRDLVMERNSDFRAYVQGIGTMTGSRTRKKPHKTQHWLSILIVSLPPVRQEYPQH